MHGTRAFPFSVSASKQDGCQGNEKARVGVEQRRATTRDAHVNKRLPIRLNPRKDSPSRGRPDTLPLHKN
ncbi:hypothetical protein NDU88_002436 [Pleurodeles waltl]|uniref:Uncharacterized protein n=1 Tax=Pleurodeles waltl TaxID=8319 RepID=A0AAV7VCU8_PLEWA|nr:hypothetical protein NDU88_002436 [Pleurodeles waltl]